MKREWIVPATVLSVHDGDTATVMADLGWRITLQVTVRILHINAPELATPEGKGARDYAKTLLVVGSLVTLASKELDKYGRSLGTLTLGDGTDFGSLMIAGGYAVPYEGGPR